MFSIVFRHPHGPDGLNHKACEAPEVVNIVPVVGQFISNEVQEIETTPLQSAELLDNNIILIPLDLMELIMKDCNDPAHRGMTYIAWAPKGVLRVMDNLCGIGRWSSFAKMKALQKRAHMTMCHVKEEHKAIYQESLMKWHNRDRMRASRGSSAGARGSSKPIMLVARIVVNRECLPDQEHARAHSFMLDLNECPPEDLQALRERCNIPGFDYDVRDFTVEFASATLLAHTDVEAANCTSSLDYKGNPHLSPRAFTQETIKFQCIGDGPERGHNTDFVKKMQAMLHNSTNKFWPAHNLEREYVGCRSYTDKLSFHAGLEEWVKMVANLRHSIPLCSNVSRSVTSAVWTSRRNIWRS